VSKRLGVVSVKKRGRPGLDGSALRTGLAGIGLSKKKDKELQAVNRGNGNSQGRRGANPGATSSSPFEVKGRKIVGPHSGEKRVVYTGREKAKEGAWEKKGKTLPGRMIGLLRNPVPYMRIEALRVPWLPLFLLKKNCFRGKRKYWEGRRL